MDSRITDTVDTLNRLVTLAEHGYTEAEVILDELMLDARMSFNTLQEELSKKEQLDPSNLGDAIVYHALYGYMNKVTCLLSKCALHYPTSVKEEFPFPKTKESEDRGIEPPCWNWANI